MGLKKFVKATLEKKYNVRYEKELAGRQCSYHAWITGEEAGFPTVSDALEDEDNILIISNPNGRIADKAMLWIREYFARFPEAVLLYGDEDVWNKGQDRTAPCFKSDWSPDLLDRKLYLGSLIAVRKNWLAEHAPELLKAWELADCGMSSKEECQKLVLETISVAYGYEKALGRERICHLPRILFHGESREAQGEWMKYSCEDMGEKQTVRGEAGRLLSIVIPSKDNPQLLDKCIGSILKLNGSDLSALKYEIIVVDNGSTPDKLRQIEAVLHHYRQVGEKNLKRILFHREPREFNFSAMCNLGAKKASGDLLMFLNDDVTLALEGTLERMAGLAVRPFTGAVGLKLLYPGTEEGKRIQHAGITNLPMGPVHKLQFCADEQDYYLEHNRGRHNCLAVTAACLVVQKSKFIEIGGFAEDLAVAFNDVDLCYSLYEQGYENVCECDHYAWHDESYSRGDDESSEKLERLLKERAKLYERHPGLEEKDPYYSVYLNRDGLDTRIRPIYEQGKNTLQQVESDKDFEVQKEELLTECREDACVMVRVESVLKGDNTVLLTGWSVVLGDNNACYEKMLLLKNEEGTVYGLELQGQYRPDLTENMPDQTRVGLCGFRVEWEAEMLPAGTYQIGMLARHRINGAGLVNWSNRML